MPITPLHLGVLAPVNHFAPNKVSNVSFILTSLWMDGNAILYYGFNIDRGEFHGSSHTFLVSWLIATIVSAFGFRSHRWICGAFLGATSHVVLDMLVHSEMNPFWPLSGNPFYFGLMQPLSIALSPLLVWLIWQYVIGVLNWVRKRQEPVQTRP